MILVTWGRLQVSVPKASVALLLCLLTRRGGSSVSLQGPCPLGLFVASRRPSLLTLMSHCLCWLLSKPFSDLFSHP